jgi:hypothetical protein
MLFIQSQFDVTYKFLNCFSKSAIVIVIQGFTAVIHYALCYTMVKEWDFGLLGVALSTNLNSLLNLGFISLWITYFERESDLSQAWFLPNSSCFRGLSQYFMMGLSACLMLCLEWWTYDMQSFIGSFISAETTAI